MKKDEPDLSLCKDQVRFINTTATRLFQDRSSLSDAVTIQRNTLGQRGSVASEHDENKFQRGRMQYKSPYFANTNSTNL